MINGAQKDHSAQIYGEVKSRCPETMSTTSSAYYDYYQNRGVTSTNDTSSRKDSIVNEEIDRIASRATFARCRGATLIIGPRVVHLTESLARK